MSEKLSNQNYSPIEPTETSEQMVSQEKEMTPEEIALEKVINIGSTRLTGVGFHELGTGENAYHGDRLIAGVLYAEQVLCQGLLSYNLARRAGIERSPYGYSPNDPSLSFVGSNDVSLYEANSYLLYGTKSFPMRQHEFSFICKYRENDSYADEGEIAVNGRVQPKDIIGIAVANGTLDSKFSSMTPYSQDDDDYEPYKKQAERIAKAVGIGPPSFDKEGYPLHDEFMDNLKKKLGYEGVETVGDYLTAIGKKYTIPIYTDDEHGLGLYWPKRFSSDEMRQFPTRTK